MKHLKVFSTISDYNNAQLSYPAVSYIEENDKVMYDGEAPFNGKFKATYLDGSTRTVECDSSSNLTKGDTVPSGYQASAMTSAVIGNCVTRLETTGNYFKNACFSGCSNLTSVTIPDSVRTIDEYTFNGCGSITGITLPNNLETIGNNCFEGCNSLESIVFPNSVKTIGATSCYNLPNLKNVVIGSGVTSIGNQAFRRCTRLQSVTCLATTPPTLGGVYVFTNTTCTIYVPAESVDLYKADYNWSYGGVGDRIQPIP